MVRLITDSVRLSAFSITEDKKIRVSLSNSYSQVDTSLHITLLISRVIFYAVYDEHTSDSSSA